MRTRSSRHYNSRAWPNAPFPDLMRQAPAATRPSHAAPPSPPSLSDWDTPPSTSPSPSPPPPRRSRRNARAPLVHAQPPLVHAQQQQQQPHPPPRVDLVLRNVAVLGLALTVSLLFLHAALYVAIVAVGILAPAWHTFKALESRDAAVVVEVDNDGVREVAADDLHVRNWQAYWIIAAIMLAADAVLIGPALRKIIPGPVYHALLFSAVSWLTRNRGGNAAALYHAYVRPLLKKSEKAIDHTVDKVLTQLDVVSQQAVIRMNEAVAPVARQLEHAAAATARQLQEQAAAQAAGAARNARFLR